MTREWLLFAAGVLIPLLGNALALCVWLPLLTIPEGTTIRPMLPCLQMGVFVLATLVTGIPTGVSLAATGRRSIGWLCILFSATPIFVGGSAANFISSARQLTWAP